MRTLALAFLTFAFSTSAFAAEDTLAPRVLVGVDPIGLRFGDGSYPSDLVTATQTFDVAGRIASTRTTSIWLGGELQVALNGRSTSIEPGMFFLFTFERLFRIPLVPMFRVGFGAHEVLETSQHATLLANQGDLKFGGSLYYFVTKHVGVGFDANIGVGIGTRPGLVNVSDVGAFTDLSAGLRFSL